MPSSDLFVLRSYELEDRDESHVLLSDLRRLVAQDAEAQGPIFRERQFLLKKFSRPEQRGRFLWAFVKLVFYVNRNQSLRRWADQEKGLPRGPHQVYRRPHQKKEPAAEGGLTSKCSGSWAAASTTRSRRPSPRTKWPPTRSGAKSSRCSASTRSSTKSESARRTRGGALTRLFIKDLEDLRKKRQLERKKQKNATSSRERQGSDGSKNRDLTNSSKSRRHSDFERLGESAPRTDEAESLKKFTSIVERRDPLNVSESQFVFQADKTPARSKGKQQSRLENVLNKSLGIRPANTRSRAALENYVSPRQDMLGKASRRYYSDFYLLKHRFGPGLASKICSLTRLRGFFAVFAVSFADDSALREKPEVQEVLLLLAAGGALRLRLLPGRGFFLAQPAGHQPPQ